MRKFYKKAIVVFLLIFILNIVGTILGIELNVYAADATDYNFTDELEEDRVGIGFVWTAENRTLTITGIKNSSAKITLPDNSIIDIQGKNENTIAGLVCNGNLLIKGNEEASLKITGCYCSTPIGYYSCVSISDTLTVESGNFKIICNGVGYYTFPNCCAGIYAKNIIINNGEIELNVEGLRSQSQILYVIYVSNSIIINDGSFCINSVDGSGIYGKSEINGGEVSVVTEKNYLAFKQAPSINPLIEWDISYSNGREEEEIEADITDIYNIYNCPIIKITKKVKLGDINEDSKINGKDWNKMYEYINETATLTKYQLKCADVNGDGKVNGKDWNRLYEHIAEVNPLF